MAEKPSTQELKKYYEDKYYQEAKGSYELEYTPDGLAYFKVRREQHEAVINAHRLPSKTSGTKSFLDVGCGEGYAMSTLDIKDIQSGGSISVLHVTADAIRTH